MLPLVIFFIGLRREGIASSIYYKWSKAFLDAGKNGLTRAVIRDATTDEIRYREDESQLDAVVITRID